MAAWAKLSPQPKWSIPISSDASIYSLVAPSSLWTRKFTSTIYRPWACGSDYPIKAEESPNGPQNKSPNRLWMKRASILCEMPGTRDDRLFSHLRLCLRLRHQIGGAPAVRNSTSD